MKPKDWHISISAGVLLGVLIVVFQTIGYQQASAANDAGGAETALTKTLQSYKTWSSLQGEARLVQYDANNKPHLDVVSVAVSQPLKANISFKSSDDAVNANMNLVADGKNIYQLDNAKFSYVKSSLPTLAHFTQDINFIPQTLADVKKDEVYDYPFAGLISNPMMEYVYPVWFGQGLSRAQYKLLGNEKIASRATWKISVKTDTDYVVAWIDQATGIILKYSQVSGGQKVVNMQFVWIKIDQKIDAQMFSPPNTMMYQQINTNP